MPRPVVVSSREFREHDGLRVLLRQFGRILVRLTCPFCSEPVQAYLWSLSGSGKKCACGAVCGPTGAWKVLKKSTAAET
jgi:hypothetical protein